MKNQQAPNGGSRRWWRGGPAVVTVTAAVLLAGAGGAYWASTGDTGGGEPGQVADPGGEGKPAPGAPGGDGERNREDGSARPAPEPDGPASSPRTPLAPAQIEAYSVQDRTLTLHFWGGVCGGYSAAAEESSGTVRVRVKQRPLGPDQVCILIAKKLTTKVTLDEPVGDRKVLDDHGELLPRA